ncbi:MAG TPA: helix-turn-helix transcriptional regulator [Nocardioides sp.]|nr:helix-turn-helix transcriptional regulator [Nocardioides sp.]
MSREVDPQRLLASARDALARRDYRTAYAALREADDHGPLPADDLSMLADAAWWLGQISEFLDLTERLHQAYLADGRVDLAAVHALGIGGTWMMRGELAQGSGWFNRGRRLLEGQPRGQGHGLLLYFDALEALGEQRLDDATAAAKELQGLGPQLGDETFTAFGLLVEGMAEVRRGHLREGFALMDEAMLPVLANRVSADWAGNIYCTIMSICYDVMDLGRAREWTRATERWLSDFSDAVMYLGVCRAHRLQLHAVEGAWSEVEREAAEVERDLLDLNLEAVAETAYQLGETYRLRGLSDLADACYRKAAERGREPQPGASLLRLATGDAEGAWSTVCTALSSAGPDPFACARLLRAQVEIGLAAGHVGAAVAAANRLDEIRQRYRTPGFAAWADQARGAALLAEGAPGDAVRPLSDAAAAYRRIAAPYDAARADLLLARAHRAQGDDDTAAAHERAAAEAFEALGVPRPWDGEVSAGTLPGGLTGREAEVLVAVAAGGSNRDVAATLTISEATVRRHLANIYVKLGVGTRTAAAAWAHEQGLTTRTG